MKASYKPDLPQSNKAIVDGAGRDNDIYLELSTGFPTPPLVGLHPRDYSMGEKIFPGMLQYEE